MEATGCIAKELLPLLHAPRDKCLPPTATEDLQARTACAATGDISHRHQNVCMRCLDTQVS